MCKWHEISYNNRITRNKILMKHTLFFDVIDLFRENPAVSLFTSNTFDILFDTGNVFSFEVHTAFKTHMIYTQINRLLKK